MNLSKEVFSDTTFWGNLQFFRRRPKIRSQPASNDRSTPPDLPSNCTAALTRLTYDYPIRKSRGSPPKLQKF